MMAVLLGVPLGQKKLAALATHLHVSLARAGDRRSNGRLAETALFPDAKAGVPLQCQVREVASASSANMAPHDSASPRPPATSGPRFRQASPGPSARSGLHSTDSAPPRPAPPRVGACAGAATTRRQTWLACSPAPTPAQRRFRPRRLPFMTRWARFRCGRAWASVMSPAAGSRGFSPLERQVTGAFDRAQHAQHWKLGCPLNRPPP